MYDVRFGEVLKMFEPVVPDAQMSSIYTYLYAKNSKDSMKRLLLNVCLDEVVTSSKVEVD